VAARVEKKQRAKCAGCGNDALNAAVAEACAQIKKDRERFVGLTLDDLYEWCGGIDAVGVSRSSFGGHLKNHRPDLWVTLLAVLPKAR
jgi:hypothetical protein